MKQIEGLTEENGAVYYEVNGQKINLTEIGDECGMLHMRKAMKILAEKADIDTKLANNVIYEAYRLTPPNRAKQKQRQEEIQQLQKSVDKRDEEITHLKEIKHQVKEIAAQQKANG